MIPKSLKIWNNIHALVDLGLGLPLFLFPTLFLQFLNWAPIDPVSARIIGSALFGIAGFGYFYRNAPVEVYINININIKNIEFSE